MCFGNDINVGDLCAGGTVMCVTAYNDTVKSLLCILSLVDKTSTC